MIITCPNCKHSGRTKADVPEGLRIRCKKCGCAWPFRAPRVLPDSRQQVLELAQIPLEYEQSWISATLLVRALGVILLALFVWVVFAHMISPDSPRAVQEAAPVPRAPVLDLGPPPDPLIDR